MSIISNIGVLNLRDIDEKLAQEITEIRNVGLLIESEESQTLLKDCKKINIGSTLKIPKDFNLNVILKNGSMKIDKEYLEGIIGSVAIVLNGSLVFEDDIDIESLNQKIYAIIVNGKVISPRRLAGLIQSKGTINGITINYTSGYKFFEGEMKLTNRFLKNLKPESQLSFENLLIIEDIDIDLMEEKIDNIQVLDKLIIIEEYEEQISQYIDEYYRIETKVLPGTTKGIKYEDKNIKIDNNSIEKYSGNGLYVAGDVEIDLKDDMVFNEYIEYLYADKVICNKHTYELIKDNLDEDVEIEIIEGKLIKNSDKMVVSADFQEETTIKNMGKLILSEELDYDKFSKNVVEIINYGVIEVPKGKAAMVENKIKANYGKIKEIGEEEIKPIKQEENILYSNLGELKL